jgi:hypothetical protein
MLSELRFLYKLGHAKELALAELNVFGAQIEKAQDVWVASKADLNINETGSIYRACSS